MLAGVPSTTPASAMTARDLPPDLPSDTGLLLLLALYRHRPRPPAPGDKVHGPHLVDAMRAVVSAQAVYKALRRLEGDALIIVRTEQRGRSRTTAGDTRRPPRRYYLISPHGIDVVRALLAFAGLSPEGLDQ